MNTMYTSVLERTREIGIMKAIGATNQAILTVFLIESGLLGLFGGIIGMLLGMGIATGVGIIAKSRVLTEFRWSCETGKRPVFASAFEASSPRNSPPVTGV